MTKEEAIKYLQELYPYGGHCWLDEQRIEAISIAIKALKEEPVSEDLEEASKNYALNNTPWDDCKDEIQEAFKAGAKWQKLKDMGITNNAKGVVTNILNSSDKSLDIYATEVAFIMLPANLTENYHMTNRDRISDAVRLGAEWQKTKDESTTEDLGDYINELSKQFPEVSFAKLSRIAVRVSRWQQNQDVKNKLPKVTYRTELDEYAYQCAYDMSNDWAIENPTWHDVEDACKLGAKWQKEHLWKPADGDDLPDIDREVIAILDYDFGHYKVVYAHRPNPNGWNGTNIDTEEKEHFEPVIYDKGGWNQPHVLYWLDAKLPYE